MMKEEFTMGYIQMIDGEKDPRNLLTIFNLTPIIINNFPIGKNNIWVRYSIFGLCAFPVGSFWVKMICLENSCKRWI